MRRKRVDINLVDFKVSVYRLKGEEKSSINITKIGNPDDNIKLLFNQEQLISVKTERKGNSYKCACTLFDYVAKKGICLYKYLTEYNDYSTGYMTKG